MAKTTTADTLIHKVRRRMIPPTVELCRIVAASTDKAGRDQVKLPVTGKPSAKVRMTLKGAGTVPSIHVHGVRARPGVHMGVRLSGGIGPLRVSVPVFGAAGGFFGAGLFALKVLAWLLWWELVLCWYLLLGCYWLLRGVYWDGPRAAWRWWQRRQAAGTVGSGA